MKKYLFVFIALILIYSDFVFGQNPMTKVWDKRYGGSTEDNFSSILPTPDGGYILSGYSYSSAGGDKSDTCRGNSDYWIVKVNSMGIKQWDKTFGGTEQERLESIILTNDGGFLLGGTSESGIGGDKSEPGWGLKDYWIVKTDSLGNKEWDKRYGGTSSDYLQTLEKTDEGGYFVFGYTNSGIGGDKTQSNWGSDDYWLVKIDSIGNKIWDRRYGGIDSDKYCFIAKINDGNYLLGGWSGSNISGDKSVPRWDLGGDFWIIKIDTSGNKIWDNRYGGTGYDALTTITQTLDNGFILGGITYSNGGGDKTSPRCQGISSAWCDYWVVKIDSAGNKQWDQDYGSGDGDYIELIYQTSDSGYVISGRSDGDDECQKSERNLGSMQTWVAKTNSIGVIQWDKTFFGPITLNSSHRMILSNDSCFVVANSFGNEQIGFNSQPSQGGSDYWLAKFCDCSSTDMPVANFNARYTTICNPNNIRFVDVSDCAVTRQWLFPGGNPSTSTDQMPNISYANAGTYSATLIVANLNGTDTLTRINYIQVYPTPSPVNVTQNGDTLISIPGDFYQWYDDNGTIAGATSQSFIPDSSGYYYVCVSTIYGCEDCSQSIFYSITSVHELNNGKFHYVKIAPNPAKNKFTIFLPEGYEQGNIEIIDVLGNTVFKTSFTYANQIEIDQLKLSSGLYFVNFTSGKLQVNKKLIIQ